MSMQPQRPRDFELANIIDKLANFVARNGVEFEEMTRQKQINNPRFSFLTNPTNEYHSYYLWRIMEERRGLAGIPNLQPPNNFQQAPPPTVWNSNNSNNNNSNGSPSPQQPPPTLINFSSQIDNLNVQQMKLREQIIQSESNLQAQRQVLMQQQEREIEDAVAKAQTESIERCANETQVPLKELDEKLQPIIDSCTKDSIQNGKLWILQQTSNTAKSQIISQYILKKALSSCTPFQQKLHLIYLINDLLHHCVRKNERDDLKNALESIVIPMYCNATINANEEQKEKLNKLLTLWSSKANFFDSCAISKLQSPPSSLAEYRNQLFSQYQHIVNLVTQAAASKIDHYQQQHLQYVKHATNQIAVYENEKQKLEQQQQQQQIHHTMMMQSGGLFNSNFNQQPNFNMQQPPPTQQQTPQFNLPPPTFPDLSRPPPNFIAATNEIPPQLEPPPIEPEPDPQPYFTLPAGLMIPLIKIEDCNYQPVDSDSIKLPRPQPPTENVIKAIEAFYAAPCHDRPRDLEGWEKLGLYEYFKTKNSFKKLKDEAIARGDRKKSKSPSPIPENFTRPPKKVKRRVYQSKSPENRSERRSKSKSRSLTPERPQPRPRESRSRKRSRTPSPPPYRNYNREIRKRRSITPPSFMGATQKAANEFIDEGNKGHQMLKKLGWTSGGLGRNQGIAEPISGGEVRDRSEMYKGVGMPSQANDPYENFRKNRSNNFIVRMKQRDMEKANK